jgi:hypothetical protein
LKSFSAIEKIKIVKKGKMIQDVEIRKRKFREIADRKRNDNEERKKNRNIERNKKSK